MSKAMDLLCELVTEWWPDDLEETPEIWAKAKELVEAYADNGSHDKYRKKAEENYAFGSDHDIEVDDDADVSVGDDGAFVQAWVWVRKEEITPT